MFRIVLALTAPLLVAACTVTAPPYLIAPAEPTIPVPPTRYAPVTAGTRSFRPVEPGDWREQNIRVTPRQGGG